MKKQTKQALREWDSGAILAAIDAARPTILSSSEWKTTDEWAKEFKLSIRSTREKLSAARTNGQMLMEKHHRDVPGWGRMLKPVYKWVG